MDLYGKTKIGASAVTRYLNTLHDRVESAGGQR